MPQYLRALRGAVSIAEDTPAAIAIGVEALLRQSFERNKVAPEDLVSIFVTATGDIHSVFPTRYARERLGLSDVPMLCAVELDVEGALPMVVRVLAHFYTDLAREEIEHVYLGAAAALRPDLKR